MPTVLVGVTPLASHPAYCTLKEGGGVWLNSINATSEPPLLTSKVPPLMLWLVGPLLPLHVADSWLK